MIWLIHGTGNAFVRALLAGLSRRTTDCEFHTTLGFSEKSNILRLLPRGLRRGIDRRTYEVEPRRLHARPWRELGRLAAGRLGLSRLTRHEADVFSMDAVLKNLDREVSAGLRRIGEKRRPHLVYGYEDGIGTTFREAQNFGIHRCYELPIAYWETSRRLLEEEARRYPDWEPTLFGTRDSQAKLDRKTQELALADSVICPSQFVYDSLPAEARRQKKCVIAEFGSPRLPEKAERKEPDATQPLRVLFAGSMTQRKGLADVFAAMRLLNRSDIELVIMGSLVAPIEFYRNRFRAFRYEPTRSHAQVISLMQTCDVLVLPSIVEGRALVQQEAMSCGLPIIVTANAGGADLVVEGKTGFLAPIRSPSFLANRLAWFADHRQETFEMGRLAKARAAEYTWEGYAGKILEAIGAPAERTRDSAQ